MQIKSWQITSVGIIFQIFGLFLSFNSYLKVVKCREASGDVGFYCNMKGLSLYVVETFLLIFLASLISVYILKNKGWKTIGALLNIAISMPLIYFFGIFKIKNEIFNENLLELFYLFSGIFLLIAGLYYFWKKV